MHDVENNAISEPQAAAAHIDAGKLGRPVLAKAAGRDRMRGRGGSVNARKMRQATLRLGSGPGSPPAAASASLPK
jgi:hypothetical protein